MNLNQMTARQVRIFELVLVLSVAFFPALIQSVSFLITGDSLDGGKQTGILYYIIWISQAILSIGLLFYILFRNNKNFGHIGFNLKVTGLDLLWGGTLMVAAWMLTGIVAGLFTTISGQEPHPLNVGFLQIHSVVLILVISIVIPLQEELIVRGFAMTEIFGLTESKKAAVTISVLIQFSYHLYQGLPAALMTLPYFILVAIYFVRTGNLNPVVISHFLLDFVALMIRR